MWSSVPEGAPTRSEWSLTVPAPAGNDCSESEQSEERIISRPTGNCWACSFVPPIPSSSAYRAVRRSNFVQRPPMTTQLRQLLVLLTFPFHRTPLKAASQASSCGIPLHLTITSSKEVYGSSSKVKAIPQGFPSHFPRQSPLFYLTKEEVKSMRGGLRQLC